MVNVVLRVCVFGSLTEFLANSDEYVYKLADNLLDAITNGEHSKTLKQNEPVSIDCHVLTDLCYCWVRLLRIQQDQLAQLFFVFFLPVQQVEKATSTQGDKNEMEVSLYKSVQWSTASVPPESHYTVRAETDIKFLTRNISVCYVTWNRSCSPSSVLDVMFGRSSRCAIVRCTAWVIALHLVCGFFISFCRYGWPLQMATASTSCENKARGLPFSCDPSTHGKNISPQSAAVLLV